MRYYHWTEDKWGFTFRTKEGWALGYLVEDHEGWWATLIESGMPQWGPYVTRAKAGMELAAQNGKRIAPEAWACVSLPGLGRRQARKAPSRGKAPRKRP